MAAAAAEAAEGAAISAATAPRKTGAAAGDGRRREWRLSFEWLTVRRVETYNATTVNDATTRVVVEENARAPEGFDWGSTF